MNISLSKRLCLTAMLTLGAIVYTASAPAQTRSLRHKVNKRVEKEWDKTDVAFDAQDNCHKSANVNAYWEPNTLRCLDRRTGRQITP